MALDGHGPARLGARSYRMTSADPDIIRGWLRPLPADLVASPRLPPGVRHIGGHIHPEGSIVSSAELEDGRVLRVVGPGDTYTMLRNTLAWEARRP